MIEFIVNWAIYVLGKLGYFGVFSLMALESACIPIPSEAILPFGGYLASSAYTGNKLNLILVIIIGTLGGTFGSVFIYYIGAKGGRPLVEKYAEKLRLSKSHLEMSDNYFNKYGEKIAFFSRLLPIIRTFISLPAGISKMNFKKFIFYTFVGSLIWSIVLGYAGYMMGENWTKIRSWLHIADYIVVVAVVGLIGYWIIKRRRKTVTEE
ncbi:DedA family protein [Clostridium folliculivorans]|uniref:Alkaline phosphatase n=1 Tax=Clostridium folliculivorans TaxID=2886038 RepID=A0A9W5Y693_9CLOT|nr:DedA family protein [Clostridium folliculivorans]GKU27367.1 alkaline phosphatase [Clostridium folliculivorans]GKU32218.1 alkaline phosphatase [Clostridium folliculivorans]